VHAAEFPSTEIYSAMVGAVDGQKTFLSRRLGAQIVHE